MCDTTMWLAIYSTLLAISTFVAGHFWQLRTVNYHQCINYHMSLLSCERQTDKIEIALLHRKRFDTYKVMTERSQCATMYAALSVVLFAIGWLLVLLDWMSFCQLVVLVSVAAFFLLLSPFFFLKPLNKCCDWLIVCPCIGWDLKGIWKDLEEEIKLFKHTP